MLASRPLAATAVSVFIQSLAHRALDRHLAGERVRVDDLKHAITDTYRCLQAHGDFTTHEQDEHHE